MFRNIHLWIGSYIKNSIKENLKRNRFKDKQVSVLFTICDHYEPYWRNRDDAVAYMRVKKWMDNYQKIASQHKDYLGNPPKHCFFYPIEEYKKELLDMVAEICRNGYGETEIHLHHHNDTSINLRKSLVNFKNKLSDVHGLLPVERNLKKIRYGFIHGDWALDNSRPDGRCCGVNDEITVLQETGCYADFTMPSAPSDTQTKIINSIYYAVDDPEKPKSHNTGILAQSGKIDNHGLLCIQGPLSLNFNSRKFGIIPRIENGYISSETPISIERIKQWFNTKIHINGRSDIIFIKLYTHGTQEKIMEWLFDKKLLNSLFTNLEYFCMEFGFRLFYVSARQMYNIVKGLENDYRSKPEYLLDYELELQS